MKFKKLNLVLILLITILVFFALYLGMKKQNLYTTDHIVNKKMPNLISTELFTGEETNLSELVAKEKFTILNIWASWCAPCRSPGWPPLWPRR